MTLVLRNLQIVIPLRRAVLRRNMEALRHILGVKEYDLGVICVDNRKIQLINYQYKKKNCPTDVLSFPFQENLAAGELPQPSFPDDYNLGDIFLGVEFIYQQCQEQKDDFYSVMTVTAAHGMCHLLGYQHRSEAEWRQHRITFDVWKLLTVMVKPSLHIQPWETLCHLEAVLPCTRANVRVIVSHDNCCFR
ncbi:endoribonuclease YbeY isoform X3 [Microcaecilia unicolor]|uniref:Endoribonuclease YbeY isoform X3 n=1 Tax=Microcaecilia unicolor TaxID=1415580 RepID=A0A6P7YP68_9AMPH|nr:endoribonuclease YbeY isoform X3 [Microcaecilia unicolor]